MVANRCCKVKLATRFKISGALVNDATHTRPSQWPPTIARADHEDSRWGWALTSAVLICLILVGWALRATMVVTMPLAFSFFVSAMLAPIVRLVSKRGVLKNHPRIGKGLGVALAMLTYLAVTAAFIGIFFMVGDAIMERLSENSARIESFVQSAQKWLRDGGVSTRDQNLSLSSLADRATSTIETIIQSVTALIAFLIIVFFFTLLMLIEENQWRKKLVTLAGPKGQKLNESVGPGVRRYLKIRTLVSAISAVAAGLWLMVTGIEDAWVWAAIIFLLNYIPNIGSILAAIPPTLMAATQSGFAWAVVVAIGLFIIEQFVGNFLDPMLQGHGNSVSPVAMLLFVLMWGWIWGIGGLFIAVPICLVVFKVCSEFEVTRPFYVALRDDPV